VLAAVALSYGYFILLIGNILLGSGD